MLDLNKSHVSTKSFGTIPFMSPELLSSGRMSRANDVFSFGIIMWQMITGKQPYEGMAPMQVLFNVVDGGLRPDEPESVPLRYKRLYTSCWHEWPENRWIRAAAAGAPPPLLSPLRAVHQRDSELPLAAGQQNFRGLGCLTPTWASNLAPGCCLEHFKAATLRITSLQYILWRTAGSRCVCSMGWALV